MILLLTNSGFFTYGDHFSKNLTTSGEVVTLFKSAFRALYV